MRIPALSGSLLLSAAALAQPAPPATPVEGLVVTATRIVQRADEALRDIAVITREDIERAGPITLQELLAREALVEFRGSGGAGQPAGLFLRGANAAQTLVLVDGLRVSSATVGTTAVHTLPLAMIERIEVVKGPLSSLYGADAMGGVIQIFTRASQKPRLTGALSVGNERDYAGSAGFTAIEGNTTVSFSAGARRYDAPSATNPRAFCHDPDRDRHELEFASTEVLTRLWQGEVISVSGFVSRNRARFDGCPDEQGRFSDDRNEQTLAGARVSSTNVILPGWSSRLSAGEGRDRIDITGSLASRYETRQQQLSWVNTFSVPGGTFLAGVEGLRQQVLSSDLFARTERDTRSVFVGLNERWGGQQLEASARRDEDDQFGARTTGSVSLGGTWPRFAQVTTTRGRSFRAPTFYDLYGPTSDYYVPNPALRPERGESTELSVRSLAGAAWPWRVTAFDHRIDDLITYVFPTMANVRRARIRGIETTLEGTAWWGVRVKGSLAAQRPRDEGSGAPLQGRADRFGRLEASRRFGAWSVVGGFTASSERYDSTRPSPGTRLPGYAIADVAVRYAASGRWTLGLTAANLLDKRYEHAVGYSAPGRQLQLSASFTAF